ncbi:hypothetical protein DPEC_G00374340 [Dallia pectoralis]|nr:hypothetical protein DPEC_G00374340 [Dallia pectoralis]
MNLWEAQQIQSSLSATSSRDRQAPQRLGKPDMPLHILSAFDEIHSALVMPDLLSSTPAESDTPPNTPAAIVKPSNGKTNWIQQAWAPGLLLGGRGLILFAFP